MRFLLFSLLCLSPLFAYEKITDESSLKILTPSLASRSESRLRLDNQLEVYLISDPKSHESGASMAVEAGSFDDPENLFGMAHFVEHMLFMGTEKYPDEKGFHAFTASHGGKINAFTADKRTVFIFSIENSAFDEALSQFKEFFSTPLFDAKSLSKECQAVDQEFSKDLAIDQWRLLHVKKALSHPEHPFHAFSIGNKQTLCKVTSEEMRAWFLSHYSSNLMHLVVYSSKPIDVMEKEVSDLFSQIPNRNLATKSYSAPIFCKETQGKLVAIKPEHPIQQLEFCWELPRRECKNLKNQPEELVASILGYEGEGSLLQLLKKEGLATNIQAQVDRLGRQETLFSLTCELSDRGVLHYDEVIEKVFAAISTLKHSGIPKYCFDEMQKRAHLLWSYQQKEEIFEFLSELAYKLPDESLSTFPSLSLAASEYDENSIHELLETLSPQSCSYFLLTPSSIISQKMDRVEKWMNVHYTFLPLKEETLKRASEVTESTAISIPKPNRFLPELVQEKVEAEKINEAFPKPKLLINSEKAKAYFAKDTLFQVPEIHWIFDFQSSLISESNLSSKALSDLMLLLAKDLIDPSVYDAKLAHLNYALSSSVGGIKLEISGFSEKAELLLNQILLKLAHLEPTKEQFATYKEQLLKEYENSADATCFTQARELTFSLLIKDYAGPKEKLSALEKISYEDFQVFCKKLFSQGFLQATLYGNQSEKSAENCIHNFTSVLAYKPLLELIERRQEVATLSQAPSYLVRQSKLTGSALFLVIDTEPFSFSRQSAANILASSLEEPFFTEMRTKQQTAYLVRNQTKEMERHLYLFFMTQSASHDPRDLLSRFELFLETTTDQLESVISKDKFASIQAARISNLEHIAENLSSMGKLLHKLAFDYQGDFAWIENEIKATRELTYEEFISTAKAMISKTNTRRLAVASEGKHLPNQGLYYTKINSVKKAKSEMTYSDSAAKLKKS